MLGSLASGLFLLSPLGCEHGPGASGRAATAGEQFFQRRRVALVVDEGVIVVQLFARLDRLQRVDVDAAVVLVGFAVRRAGVVDPARVVAAPAAVDHAAVVQGEIKGVVDRAAGPGRALGRFIPADALAPVFDDAFAGFDVAAGEDAVAVDRRLLHFIGRVGLGCGLGGHVAFDGRAADRLVRLHYRLHERLHCRITIIVRFSPGRRTPAAAPAQAGPFAQDAGARPRRMS